MDLLPDGKLTPHVVLTEDQRVWHDFEGPIPRQGELVHVVTDPGDGTDSLAEWFKVLEVRYFTFAGKIEARVTVEPHADITEGTDEADLALENIALAALLDPIREAVDSVGTSGYEVRPSGHCNGPTYTISAQFTDRGGMGKACAEFLAKSPVYVDRLERAVRLAGELLQGQRRETGCGPDQRPHYTLEAMKKILGGNDA